MSYIGNTNTTQAFTPAIDYFSGNASTTAFTLSKPVASVAQVQVVVNNVAQNPSSAYTVSSNTITFTSAPSSGTNNIYVYYTSPITQLIAPSQGTVTSSSFGTITDFTTTGNTTLGDATTDTLTVGVTGIVKDASGNVGIGTASPSYKLQVYGASNPEMRLGDAVVTYQLYTEGATAAVMGTVGSHALVYRTNATERMRIDSSGNVGIGTASPIAPLHILNGAASAPAIYLQNGNKIGFTAAQSCQFGTWNGTTYTENMRIDTSGNLLVGATSAPSISGVASNSCIVSSSATGNWQLGIQNTSSSGGPRGVAVQYSAQAPNGTASESFFFTDSAAYRFSVRSNGGIANYSANNVNISDRREKINFAPAKSYLDVICAIPVQTFNYIDQNTEEDPGLTLGVVAQDVQAVAPELVMESDWSSERDGSKIRLSIYQTDLQYALMKCIQEQQALITSLTARITALENK